MNIFTKPPQKSPLLPLATEDGNYRVALAKKSILMERLRETTERIEDLWRQIQAAKLGLHRVETDFQRHVEQAIEAGDGSFDPPLNVAAATLEVHQLLASKEVLEAALSKQTQLCEDILLEISCAAARRIKAEHQRRVAAIAQALDDLRSAALAEQDLHRELCEAGYRSELEVFRVPRLNVPVLDLYGDNWGNEGFIAQIRAYLK